MAPKAPQSSLTDCVKRFEQLTSKPEDYLSAQDELLQPIKCLTKSIYDLMKNEEKTAGKTALPKLIVDNFDEEQIWQEIELQNEDKWTGLLQNVSHFLNDQNDFKIPVNIGIEHSEDENDLYDENGDVDEENDAMGEEEEEDIDEEPMNGHFIEKKKDKPKKSELRSKPSKKTSIVDDKFFRLDDMEDFLDAEDRAEMMKDKKKKNKNEESDDDDSDEEIDLFDPLDSDEEDPDEKNAKDLMYGDFFDDAPFDGDYPDESNRKNAESDEFEDEEPERRKNKKKKVRFNMSQSDEDDDDEIDDGDEEIDLNDVDTGKGRKNVRFSGLQPSSDEDDDEAEDPSNLSEFQQRQQRLKKKISYLENSMLEEKAWTMKGEIDATSRPQNSLLEEIVDFDITSRPAPIITEETTMKLQDIIIQRIKDKSWDDVERKAKPVQEVHEFKKQIVLDQEKSKLSLAQVYEQEYVKQRDALDPNADEKPEEEPPAHVEIRSMMSSLFEKLDALSNFHYTPKLAVPEVKIISNIPAIEMEEVAPVATSDAKLLAPEEIKSKQKGDLMSKSERTDTDKKRERRKKKMHQREKEKEKLKRARVIDKIKPGLGNKYSKEKVNKLLKKVTEDRNVEKMNENLDKKSFASSTAFFNQLQDEVKTAIKSKINNSKPKNKRAFNAKQMKL